MELATKFLKLQEQQRKSSKTYYEKNKERLIKLNLDKINEIKSTEEYKEKKAKWNKITVEKNKSKAQHRKSSKPKRKAKGATIKHKINGTCYI